MMLGQYLLLFVGMVVPLSVAGFLVAIASISGLWLFRGWK